MNLSPVLSASSGSCVTAASCQTASHGVSRTPGEVCCPRRAGAPAATGSRVRNSRMTSPPTMPPRFGDEVYILYCQTHWQCLLAIGSFYPSHPLAREIVQRLTVLAQTGKRIALCWIPSHVGIDGNELADAAANRASQRACTRIPLPVRDVRSFPPL